jgi:cleavage and polyadenylation specificity factor subunit 6/7
VEEVDYGDDEDFDDLYNDVNIGDGFFDSSHQPPPLPQKPLPPSPPLNQPHQLPPAPQPQQQLQQPMAVPHSLPPPPPPPPPPLAPPLQ